MVLGVCAYVGRRELQHKVREILQKREARCDTRPSPRGTEQRAPTLGGWSGVMRDGEREEKRTYKSIKGGASAGVRYAWSNDGNATQ